MTAEQENQLRDDIVEILEVLRGPSDDPRKGLVWKVAQHHDDLNGPVGDTKSGVKSSLASIRDKVFRAEWWIRGLIAAVFAGIMFAAWLISNWNNIRNMKP